MEKDNFSCVDGTPTDATGRELAMHGSTAFPVDCFEVRPTFVKVLPHWHEEFEVLTVLTGLCSVHLGSGKEYVLRPGESFFVNAGALHSMPPAPNDAGQTSFRSLVFSPRLIAGGLESVFWEKYIGPLREDDSLSGIVLDKGAAKLVSDAWTACSEEEPGYEFAVRSALSTLMCSIALRAQSSRMPAPRTRAQARSEERVKSMMQFVHENYSGPLTLADLCAHAALSPSECLRCFRSTIDTPPMQYVKVYRLTRAAELLARTAMPANEIAARCGFLDAGYFSKSFRTWSGVTPSEYRRIHAPAAEKP